MYQYRALPVSLSEFTKALRLICKPSPGENNAKRIALAISGGVDSMALAHLSHALQCEFPNEYYFVAMVVDHRSRENSTSDAKRTCSTLNELGLRTNVLSLSWNEANPMTLPNFESRAREKRYAALRDECVRLNVHSLLTAHHLDDQSETVLMRITQGYTGYGLCGMRGSSTVPKPPRIFHGSPERTSPEAKYLVNTIRKKPSATHESFSGVIANNIQIGRPLLSFTKERLVSTCCDAKLAWTEDSTNKDKTLTRRNAVRYLLNKGSLPKALRRQSLIQLCRSMTARRRKLEQTVLNAFDKITVNSLDPRTGVLEFVLPKHIEGLRNDRTSPISVAHSQLRVGVELAKKIARIVRPESDLHVEQFAHVAALMFPQGTALVPWDCQSLTQPLVRNTAGGVLWESPSLNVNKSSWRVSRQVPRTSDLQLHCSWNLDYVRTSCWLPWQLFDFRFWIRICIASATGSRYIAARRFTKNDMTVFRSSLSDMQKQAFNGVLKSAAPGKTRWTLPVLVDDQDTPLILPTLGLTTTSTQRHINWQFAYRGLQLPCNTSTVARLPH